MDVEDIAARIDGAGGQFAARNRAGVHAASSDAQPPFTARQAWAAIAAIAAVIALVWWLL
jgi:hypothetical protein